MKTLISIYLKGGSLLSDQQFKEMKYLFELWIKKPHLNDDLIPNILDLKVI